MRTKSKWWPDKKTREDLEVEGYIMAQKVLPHGRNLVIETKGERPDYILKDIDRGERLGVELTSVYLDAQSVPQKHRKVHQGPEPIPFDRSEIELYKSHLVDAVREKIKKAQSGYDISYPLVLSVYVNEYCSIYIEREEMEKLVADNSQLFDSMAPFCEVVFWNLPSGGVFSITPE